MSQAKIWDRFAKGYAKRPVSDQASYERKLEMTKKRLRPTDHVLEVGCGTGSTALWHAPHVASIEATDFSAQMIALAQAKSENFHNVTFRIAHSNDPPMRAQYDAILAMSILHLLPDPAATLQQLTGRLRPGGYLFSSTVCLHDMGRLIAFALPILGRTNVIPKVTALSKNDLLKIHEAAGLTILEEFQPGPGKAIFLIAQAPPA